MDAKTTWTTEQILALASDAASAKSGLDLSAPRKWVTRGRAEAVVWGECQGSGAKPYRTAIDLSEPAFKCSCPSRKFPCKHGLGLFLMYESQAQSIEQGTPPSWVSEWLESRSKRVEQAAVKKEQPSTPRATDPAAQAKVAAQREARVSAGVKDFRRWLGDLTRNGLSAAQAQPSSFWEGPASRLVDSQAPGLARMVRQMAGIPASGEGWPDRLLEEMGRVHLLVESFERIERLPLNIQAEVRTLMGWTQSQDELLALDGVSDRWAVLGQRVVEEDRLRTQRTWLWGTGTGQHALVLDFAHGSQPLDKTLVAGTILDAELVFFAGAIPSRALVKKRNNPPSALNALEGVSIAAAIEAYAAALALNPWLNRFPVLLGDVVPMHEGERWWVRDGDGHALPLTPRFAGGWQFLAVSGGHPVTLFGEWNGRHMHPVSVWNGRLVQL
ncbi:MAG: SWIM zinc finger family protein [Chloroflexota bacterium]